MSKKYSFSEPTKEEQEIFMTEFNAILEKYSLVAETIPQLVRSNESGEFALKGTLMLSKKTEIVEPILSDNAEINPLIKELPTDETTTEA